MRPQPHKVPVLTAIKKVAKAFGVPPWSTAALRKWEEIVKVNIGCGMSPIVGEGWLNFDNSVLVGLVQLGLPRLLVERAVPDRLEFFDVVRAAGIKYANALAIPLKDGTAEFIYCSHMLEHLDELDGRDFVRQCHRLLAPNGVVRLIVPDFQDDMRAYLEFLENPDDPNTRKVDLALLQHRLDYGMVRPRGLYQRLCHAFIGHRGHRWNYDHLTLPELLREAGFVDVRVVEPGMACSHHTEGLQYEERIGLGNLCVEGRKS